MDYTYDVFISYRHKPLDGVITQKTFNLIEGYKLPKALQSKGHDIKRVFRDTEELSVSRILTDTIDKALHSANCLCIVCSVDTPSSEWVDREVAMFIELGRADKVFPLLISGTPETSFPPSLKKIPDIMDRVMDVRAPGNDAKQIIRNEDMELLKIISCATGVDYKALVREHKLRKNNRIVLKALAAVGTFVAVSAVSLGLMRLAQNYRDRAQAAEAASMKILEELTYGLPDKLTGIPGAYETISSILTQNAEQINSILMLSTDKTAAGMEVAANYEKLATAMSVMGDYVTAADKENEALKLYDKLCAETGDLAPLASAKNNLGKILSFSGKYEEAAAVFEEAIALQRQLPASPTLAVMLNNAGGNAVQLNRGEEVQAYLNEALEFLETQEDSYEVVKARAAASYNLGVFRYRQGSYAEAEKLLLQSVEVNRQLCGMVDSIESRNALLEAVSTLGLSLTDQGNYAAAEEYLLQAISLAEALAEDGENTESVSNLASLYNNCGINYNLQQNYAEAANNFDRARELFRGLSQKTDSLNYVVNYAEACMNIGDNTFKLGEYDRTKKSFEEGIAAFASAEERLSTPQLAEYYVWNAYKLLVCDKDYNAALDKALAAYDMQPTSPLVNMILGYVCLYSGYYDDADFLLGQVAGLGDGQREMILLDLDAQQASGLSSPHIPDLISVIS